MTTKNSFMYKKERNCKNNTRYLYHIYFCKFMLFNQMIMDKTNIEIGYFIKFILIIFDHSLFSNHCSLFIV